MTVIKFVVYHVNETPFLEMDEQSLLFGRSLNTKFTNRMRHVMLAWIYDVLQCLKITNDNTFPNTICILDAFMAKKRVPKCQWKLLAACSMWISMKLHEVEGCDRDSIVYSCFHDDKNLQERYGEILHMERDIFTVLDGKLLYDNPLDALSDQYYRIEKRKDVTLYEYARNLSFRYYWNEDYQKFNPSDIGISSLVLIYIMHAEDSSLLTMANIQQAIEHYQLLEGFKAKYSWLDQRLKITCLPA